MRKVTSLLFLVSSAAIAAEERHEVGVISSAVYERRAYVVPASQLSVDFLVAHATKLLAEGTDNQWVVHHFSDDKREVLAYLAKELHASYENTRYRMQHSLSLGWPLVHEPFGEVSIVNGAALVRHRNHGTVTQRVIGKANPLAVRLTSPRVECEILAFSFLLGDFTLCAQCSKWPAATSLPLLAEQVARSLPPGTEDATLYVRGDDLFMDISAFPMWYAFGSGWRSERRGRRPTLGVRVLPTGNN
jgi:hypothetical protein